jgi:hypothetical protein
VWQLSELQTALLMKCVPVPGEKLDILMCVMPLMVPVLRSIQHVSNFVRWCFKKYWFLHYTLWLKICNVLFYCHLRLNILYTFINAVFYYFWNPFLSLQLPFTLSRQEGEEIYLQLRLHCQMDYCMLLQ